MKRKAVWVSCFFLALALLLGCQTAKPMAPEESAIQAEKSGFSPKGSVEQATMELSLLWGNGESITSWKVEIAAGGAVARTWSGDSGNLPASLNWDGKSDSGDMAQEGKYTARLSIEYGKTYQPLALESKSFVLDLTPPTGSIALDPAEFTPSDQGVSAPMTLTISAASALAKIDSWSLNVYDPEGGLVKSFSGQWLDAAVTWDGSTSGGGFVTPATTYSAVATVVDEYGNSAELKTDVPVADIPLATEENLVQPRGSGFSPYSDTMGRTIILALTFGNKESLKSWKLSVSRLQTVERSWSGDASNLPQFIEWDGKTSTGAFAPDGVYSAVLSIDYGLSYKPVLVRSRQFVLDVAAPACNVAVNPLKLAADGKGGIEPVTFTVYGSSEIAMLDGWTLNILDARGQAAASFKGGWPAAPASWDGSLAGGGRANPTQAYTYVARIRDVYGNVGEVKGSLVTGELPAVQGTVSIVPSASGFSPNADKVSDTIRLALSFGQPSAVVSWKVEVSGKATGVQYTSSGKGTNPSRTLAWDGKTDKGTLAPEDSYTAKLSVDYGTVFAPVSTTSAPFDLVVTPPTGTINLSSPLFSPLEDSDTITIALAVVSPRAKIDSWTMDIYDPGGNIFRSFSGKWPADTAVWDGKGTKGDMVQSAEDYPVVAKVRDQYGNTAVLKTVVPIDILVEKMGSGYRILASRIFFKSFTADYKDVAADLAKQNANRLDALAKKLDKFPDYNIRIVGHAVMINWDNPALGKAEQEKILIPLSKARADAVKEALVERGLDAARFTTEGVGAADQLVPDSNYKDRWQNRRVALFLEKP